MLSYYYSSAYIIPNDVLTICAMHIHIVGEIMLRYQNYATGKGIIMPVQPVDAAVVSDLTLKPFLVNFIENRFTEKNHRILTETPFNRRPFDR
jgi:hypothetical protein